MAPAMVLMSVVLPQLDSPASRARSEEHTSELQSLRQLVCRLLLEKKKLTSGRREQTQDLRAARTEMTSSLALTTAQLKAEIDNFNQSTAQSLEAIRDRVDTRLLAITDQVQAKLDQNIKEGFAQFEKVQQHLKAAEEQLREVGALGHSINDLNNLLKLPHLRGTFGEASLERLLADFLPAHMLDRKSTRLNSSHLGIS